MEDWNWETIFYKHYRSIFNHWYNWPENLSNSVKNKIRGITAFKVIEVGTNRKPGCDLLLVINSNWHLISYRFGVIAAFFSHFGHWVFEPPFGGLRDNVRCSSWVHWKARSGLPISVTRTFFARCYGWVATSKKRLKICDLAPMQSVWSKISGNFLACLGSRPPSPCRPLVLICKALSVIVIQRNYVTFTFCWSGIFS